MIEGSNFNRMCILICLTYDVTIIRNDSLLCYDVIMRIKILKIDKFVDFSCDILYNSRTDVFRDVFSLIINQCDARRPQGASDRHKVSASRAAQASDPRLYVHI